jgi:hypothetical protein
LPRGGIKKFKSNEIDIAFVSLKVNALTIPCDNERVHTPQHITAVNLRELVGVNAQYFRIAVLCGSRCHSQLILQIKKRRR